MEYVNHDYSRMVGQHKGVYQSSNAVWNYKPFEWPKPCADVQLFLPFPEYTDPYFGMRTGQ